MSLEEQIKQVILSTSELQDMQIDDIDNDAPLFGDDGVGLDSIDALELGIALKKEFGTNFSTAETENKKHFYSVSTLATYIQSQK